MSTGGHNRQRRSLDDPTKNGVKRRNNALQLLRCNYTIIVKYGK